MADQMVPIALPITFSKVCEVVNQDLNGTNGRHLFGPGGQFAIATGVFDPNYVAAKGSLACFRGYKYQSIILNNGSIVFVTPTGGSNVNINLYDPINNSTTLLFATPLIFNTDIAHTANKMWSYSSAGGGAIEEFNITLNPFTQTHNRRIANTRVSAGLCAINDTTLITMDANEVYESNITTNTASSTLKFSIPFGRQVTGDFVYTTTGKFLVLSNTSNAAYLSQYNYTTGALEVEINITSTTIQGYGLYQHNNQLYLGTGDNKIYHINLASPYTLTLQETTNVIIYGASQIPSFVNVNLSTAGGGADTTAPTIPNITSLSQSGSAIIVNWTGSTDAVGVTQYELWRKENSNPAVLYDYPTASPYVDDWGTTNAGFTYTYTLRAKDAAGNYSAYSTGKSITTPTSGSGDTVAPTTPSITALNQYAEEIYIDFTASTDNVGVVNYEIWRQVEFGGYSFHEYVPGLSTPYVDRTVSGSAGVTFGYKVRAIDAAGNASAFSNQVQILMN